MGGGSGGVVAGAEGMWEPQSRLGIPKTLPTTRLEGLPP